MNSLNMKFGSPPITCNQQATLFQVKAKKHVLRKEIDMRYTKLFAWFTLALGMAGASVLSAQDSYWDRRDIRHDRQDLRHDLARKSSLLSASPTGILYAD